MLRFGPASFSGTYVRWRTEAPDDNPSHQTGFLVMTGFMKASAYTKYLFATIAFPDARIQMNL